VTNMRPVSIACFLLIVTWHAYAQAQQPTHSAKASNNAKCKITGTVARQDTGEPLKKATVILRSNENVNPAFAITDAQGHFEFANVEPGSYRLDVSHNGYLNSEYGQKKPGDPGANLSLAPGQSMTDLIFNLLRSAAITGHVIDEDGEPLPNVSVRAYRGSSRREKSGLRAVAWASTNDVGEYRIFDLWPGRYLIRANYQSRKYLEGITPSSPQMSKEDYPPTFYPNSTDSSKAGAITVKAGDEIPAVDFILKPSPVVTVTGRVFSPFTTQPDSGLGVSLISRGEILSGDDARLMGESFDSKGAFVIRNVFPGSYILEARLSNKQEHFSARRELEVGNSDVEGVSLTITRGVDVPGHLLWEQKPPSEVRSPQVALQALDQGTDNSGAHEVKADGSFVIKNVSEGVYRPQVFTGSGDCHVKSARYGLAEVVDGGLAIRPGTDTSLELTISCRAARIEGAVLTADSLPAAGVYVVAIPDAPFGSQEWKYRAEVTDQNGRFLLRGIMPGKYRIFSWRSADDFDWYDPEQLKPYESKGVSVDVQEGDQKTVQLTVIETENASQARQ
jgi:protocatechuate 3,4-dioxygenase beta subunit